MIVYILQLYMRKFKLLSIEIAMSNFYY